MNKTLILIAIVTLAGCSKQSELVALENWQACSVALSPDLRCPADKVIRKPDVTRVVEHLIIDKKGKTLQPASAAK